MATVDIIDYSDRVSYKMYNAEYGWSKQIPEPKGWDEDDKELKRSMKVFGVFTELSSDLKFTGIAYDYIYGIYLAYGVEAEILMIKSEKHPETDEWEVVYTGYLDLITLKIELKSLSCKFNESGFYKKIMARKNEPFELTRLDDINGNNIDELSIKKVELRGQKIFLVSKLIYDPNNETIRAYHEYKFSGHDFEATAVPFQKEYANDDLVDPIQGSFDVPIDNNGNYLDAYPENIFYGINDRYKQLHIQINLQMSWYSNYSADGYRVYFDVVKYKYNNGAYEYVDTLELGTVFNLGDKNNHLFSADFYVQLLEGECLACVIKTRSFSDMNLVFHEGNYLLVEEDSFFDPTVSNVLLPHEAGERLINIMTGVGSAFKSSFFGRTNIVDQNQAPKYSTDGIGAKVGMLYGFWIRGFDATPPVIPENATDEERSDIIYDQPITTSFDDWFDSYSGTFNLGYGLERSGGKEKIVVEEMEYFFLNEIRVTIPIQVNNVKRSPAKEFMYKSLSFGQKNGGDFEEQMGLDEYNVTTKYSTSLFRTEQTFVKETEYRKDGYPIETLRRKSKETHPTEDTDNDQAIFMYDMKDVPGGTYTGILWPDRFEEAPKNVFSPETAPNLWLSPANCLLRFGWWLKASLALQKSNYIRYSSSTGNSDLVTKLIGKEELKERAKIKNGDLERNRFVPEWIEFDAVASREIINQVYGSTDGIPNFYGLVSFINERNVQEFGYLFSLKPAKEGKWKLLKANR